MRRVLALAVLALPLAACGGSGTKSGFPSSSTPSLAQAATRSASASTLKLDFTMTMTAPNLPSPATMTASGVENNTSHQADMNFDMSGFASSLGKSAPKQFTNPALWRGEEIADFSKGRFVLYMHLPLLTNLVPDHKPWIKLDLSAYGKRLGIDFTQLTQFSSNPGQTLDWLRSTNGAITRLGSETVDGVRTTHYKAAIDLAKYPSIVSPARRAAVRKAISAVINLTGLRTFPVDAWVSDDGLVRKMNMSFTEDVSGQQLTMNMTTRFHDFNSPVSIKLPPANQVLDSTQFVGASGP
jgi:hypothetical protein